MFSSVRALESFLEEQQKVGIKPGLSRMKRLLRVVSDPERGLPAVHVAGTNGKGSTVTYIASMLREADHRVGTFTSPSITNRQAMIQLNGRPISDQLYLNYANKIAPELTKLAQENNSASPFEIIVAIAIQFFAEHADLAIVETGMGGLEDATNLIDPIVSIITSIDYDHTAFLGDAIEEIAFHKAGIIKQNKPVVVGDIADDAFSVIKKVAAQKNSTIYRIDETFQIISIANQPHYQDQQKTIPLKLRLRGDHQLKNSALAVKAGLILKESNYQLSDQQMITGLYQAHLPARFEQIHDHPTVIIDGAHNPASITAFVDVIEKEYQEVETRLIFAVFKDKSSTEMIKLIEPHFEEIIFTSFDHERAESADRLFKMSNHPHKKKYRDWENLIDQILDNKDDQKVTFIVGSLDFVGKIRGYIK